MGAVLGGDWFQQAEREERRAGEVEGRLPGTPGGRLARAAGCGYRGGTEWGAWRAQEGPLGVAPDLEKAGHRGGERGSPTFAFFSHDLEGEERVLLSRVLISLPQLWKPRKEGTSTWGESPGWGGLEH